MSAAKRVLLIAAVLLTELDILANVIAGEAPNCPQEHQIAVAAVVSQAGQYSESYLIGADAPDDCYEAARIALSGEHDVPVNVVYQANFPQGDAVWWASEVDTGYYRSTTYFCEG